MSSKLIDIFLLSIKSFSICLIILILHKDYLIEDDFPLLQFQRCLSNQRALLKFLKEEKTYAQLNVIQSKLDLKKAKSLASFPKLIQAHPFYIGEEIYRSYQEKAWCDYHGESQAIHYYINQVNKKKAFQEKQRFYILIFLDLMILLGLFYVLKIEHHVLESNLDLSLCYLLYLLLLFSAIAQYFSFFPLVFFVGLILMIAPIVKKLLQ
ncbi:hypothetical protein MJH12_16745 [bacterium]|nr:hypothetical protein [bacterium]